MRKSRLLIAVAAVGVFLALATAAFADHSWNGYHWLRTEATVSPTVVDKTSSLFNVPAGVAEWTALSTPITPTLTDAKKGDITVTEAFSPFWLGLARIFIDENGHITKGEVKLNTRLLQNYGPAAADHVLCQELGHVLGLGHNRADSDSNTCMNDQATLGSATYPNQHDTDQLNLIYGHVDVVDDGTTDDGDGGGNGGPDCGTNSKAKQCRSGNGQWITVHVFPIP